MEKNLMIGWSDVKIKLAGVDITNIILGDNTGPLVISFPGSKNPDHVFHVVNAGENTITVTKNWI